MNRAQLRRLHFAWARGAKLQRRMKEDLRFGDDRWSGHDVAPTTLDCRHYEWRIHPKDAHLEYGPLSTALRQSVLLHGDEDAYDEWLDGLERLWGDAHDPLFLELTGHWNWWGCGAMSNTQVRNVNLMHRLFLAELLADEGL